jgi:hypothetical protein
LGEDFPGYVLGVLRGMAADATDLQGGLAVGSWFGGG